MPYFVRLPYAEMIARAAGLAPAANSAGSTTQEAKTPTLIVPILDQAQRILREESIQLPSSSLGRLTIPFLDTLQEKPNGSGILPGPENAGSVLLLTAPPAVKAGQTATVVLSMVNDSGADLSFSVMTTHLVSPSGARIAANNVDISPEEAVVGPSQAVDVRIVVSVPAIAIPGEYSGLVQVYGQQTARAVLVINVTN
jgi:hypothetical protein